MAERRAAPESCARALGGAGLRLTVLMLAAGAFSAAAVAASGLQPTRAGAPGVGVIGNDAPAWSPSGDTIAFTSFRHGRGEIYLMRPDGKRQRRLTRNPAHDDLPAWSPNGRRIAFTSSRTGGRDIYVMDVNGGRVTRLTNHPAFDFSPAWSPDGTRIAFRSNRDGNGEIYVMTADGTRETNLTRHPRTDESPRWSPDGRIVFASNRTSVGLATPVFSIYAMNADGTDVRKLTSTPSSYEDERTPDWSPDGRRIVFTSDRDLPIGNLEIYTMNADGTGRRRLTRYIGHDDWPTWSPDGQRIVFSRGPDLSIQELHVMRADGSAVRRLTKTTRASRARARRASPRTPLD
jgi:Tol biopolymer transport system component